MRAERRSGSRGREGGGLRVGKSRGEGQEGEVGVGGETETVTHTRQTFGSPKPLTLLRSVCVLPCFRVAISKLCKWF